MNAVAVRPKLSPEESKVQLCQELATIPMVDQLKKRGATVTDLIVAFVMMNHCTGRVTALLNELSGGSHEGRCVALNEALKSIMQSTTTKGEE